MFRADVRKREPSWVLFDDKGYAIFDNFSVYDTRLNISDFREAS